MSNSQAPFVALLLEDIKEAQKFNRTFRKLGILPQYFSNLGEFWKATLEEKPVLAIVDIKVMSDRNFFLGDHPHVKSESLPLVFYYKEQTKALLSSTTDIFHFGFICKEEGRAQLHSNYDGQVKSVLKRVNKYVDLGNDNTRLVDDLKRERNKTRLLISSGQRQRQKREIEKLQIKIIDRVEAAPSALSFFDRINYAMSSWKELDRFAYFELSDSGNKLISPKVQSSKYTMIPSLWLGEKGKNGIEYFAQNMAYQVASDLLGEEVKVIRIYGKNDLPDALLFLNIEESVKSLFDWRVFETFLSSAFRKEYISDEYEKGHLEKSSSWNFLTVLDEEFNENFKGKSQLIDIGFGQLHNLINKNQGVAFFWKSFCDDFVTGLRKGIKKPLTLSFFGVDHLAVLLEGETDHGEFEFIKKYAMDFSYWRYFEDEDTIFSEIIEADVKMVPVSARAYLSYIQKPKDAQQSRRRTFQTNDSKKIAWGSAVDVNSFGDTMNEV
ncbi:MAG: hypothetical protein HOE90_08905 [Bacteriovoracaceae bacterium]|jgi:hypothetical protein|nr:hypothetical protein [Bacteriovoracaceae bacterium]